MDPYSRGPYQYRDDYPPPRRVPRSYDPFPQGSYDPPHVEYPRQADRVYSVNPGAVSYPALPSNSNVEIRYYDPALGPPVPYQPSPVQPAPAPAPPRQIQLPGGSGTQFIPGQLYKVVGVEEAQLYHGAPPQPRTDHYVPYDYGYPSPSLPRGPPTRRHYQLY